MLCPYFARTHSASAINSQHVHTLYTVCIQCVCVCVLSVHTSLNVAIERAYQPCMLHVACCIIALLIATDLLAAERHLLHLLSQTPRAGTVHRCALDLSAQLEPV